MYSPSYQFSKDSCVKQFFLFLFLYHLLLCPLPGCFFFIPQLKLCTKQTTLPLPHSPLG